MVFLLMKAGYVVDVQFDLSINSSIMRRLWIIILSVLSLTAFAQTDKLVRRISYELGKVEGSIPQINMLMKKGEKVQAREMVDAALQQMEQIEAYQKEAALMDETIEDEDLFILQAQETKRFLVNKANQLKNAIGIYISCDAKIFGNDYSLKDELEGQLADLGCSFVEEKEQADWVITISASSREGNKMTAGGFSTYFSYVDLTMSIDKVANGKRVYQNAFSEKGGDTRSYEFAAKEAFMEISPQISAIIKEQVKQ